MRKGANESVIAADAAGGPKIHSCPVARAQTIKKNPDTLAQYQTAIQSHLTDTNTYTHGTYQYVPGSTVHFNPVTNNAVILGKDGSFVSGWKLAPGTSQYDNFIKNGVLR